ncbi:hypothetical protein F8M41_024927 [Gigaspora margarita]|uniref:Uncharacterized protein n=1 Tax=Gigaspora margarita TaxID=4874 RepID=A0A8H4ET21_GIGMA|nr:hypothetical protein F8M41_024927 [Gigaspora margarita]
MDQKEVIGALKIFSFLLYFILWIYFEVKEFDSHMSKSFSINIIFGFAFALSIIFFCTEIAVLSAGKGAIITNSCCIIVTYLTLSLVYSGVVSIGDLYLGKVHPALIILLWIISMLSLIQIIISAKELTYWQFFKIVKILFIVVYLIDYIIYTPYIIKTYNGERYSKYYAINIFIVFIIGIIDLILDLITYFVIKLFNTVTISFIILITLSPILFTFIYFGVAFSNIYFLLEGTYTMIDGLIWAILISSFVEIVFFLNS